MYLPELLRTLENLDDLETPCDLLEFFCDVWNYFEALRWQTSVEVFRYEAAFIARIPDACSLYQNNCDLWFYEGRIRDLYRQMGNDPTQAMEIVHLKKCIDRSNMQRHHAIAAVDAFLHNHCKIPSDGNTPCLRELGMLADDLCILVLKKNRIQKGSNKIKVCEKNISRLLKGIKKENNDVISGIKYWPRSYVVKQY